MVLTLLKSDFLDEITRWPRTSEFLKIAEGESAGVEIDPTPRGIIFSLLGFPGGSHNKKKIKKFSKVLQNPKIPLTPISICWDLYTVTYVSLYA